MRSKLISRLAISLLDMLSILFSAASRQFVNLVHAHLYTTVILNNNDVNLGLPDVHMLEEQLAEALVGLAMRDIDIEQLKSRAVREKEDLETKTRQLGQLKDKVQDLEAKAQDFQSLIEELRVQARNLEKKLQSQIALTKASEGQLHKAQAAIVEGSRTIDSLQDKFNTTLSLLESCTTELQGARKLVGEPDSISDLDAVKLVNALNAEIFQTAALLAESFGSIASRAPEGLDNRNASGRIRQMFGPRLVDLLRSIPHAENPVLLRVAFQACMVVFSDWISAAWHFQSDPAPQFFGEVYRNVWLSEDQAISGRWRSLTRRHIQQLLNENANNLRSRFAVHISNSLADVLLCAGLHNKHSQVSDTVMALAGEKILTVVEVSLRLNRLLGEEITAADIETTWVHSQEAFDAIWMEDDYGDWRSSAGLGTVRVLCTTDLGLRRLVKSGDGEGWEDAVLLKPKVALEESLDSLELDK